MNTWSEICIFFSFFLAKWVFLSFDRAILIKKSGGGGLVALLALGKTYPEISSETIKNAYTKRFIQMDDINVIFPGLLH